jgi:hypothetical protein
VRLPFDSDAMETPTGHCTVHSPNLVHIPREDTSNPLHSFRQSAATGPDHEVIVIPHRAIRMNFELKADRQFAKPVDKRAALGIALEDRSATGYLENPSHV